PRALVPPPSCGGLPPAPAPALPAPLPTTPPPQPPPPLCLPSASRWLLALLPSLSPPLPPSRPRRSPHPASLPLPQPLLSSPHPASLPPSPARRSQSRHQGGSRCSTMTGIAAASFFSNTCRFGGCGLHFPTLADLIEHIEDNHIDTDPRVLEKQELQQPTYVALSYINSFRFFYETCF
uniref:JAZF zinc finger 1 n=1 Tax=Piliocolobus tephrosceles TaxID=591936 RepID=A0A8C9HI42_9PRIM